MYRPISLMWVLTSLCLMAGHTDQDLIDKARAVTKLGKNGNLTDQQARVVRTRFGYHIRFQQTYQGLPIWNVEAATVHFNKDLSLKRKRETPAITSVIKATHSPQQAQDQATFWLSQKGIRGSLHTVEEGYYQKDQQVAPITRIIIATTEEDGMPQKHQVDVNRATGAVENHSRMHFNFAEAGATVYAHNPIAGTGNSPVISRDWSSALVNVTLRGLDGTGILRGEYVDLTAPGITPQDRYAGRSGTYSAGQARPTNGRYDFHPDDERFEEVMAYYYVDSCQRALQSLGFNILDRPIPVHAHHFPGLNAYFSSSNNDYGLHFGDGDIDTAEDASVINHEYGHAILNDAAGPWPNAEPGRMFHEAFADYFALVMGRIISEEVGPDHFPLHEAEWFMSQRRPDNDPPYLRTFIRPAFSYPDLTGSYHRDGELWSYAFYVLDQLGEPFEFFSLLMETIPLVDTAEPEKFPLELLNVDQQHFGGKFSEAIIKVMSDIGLYHPAIMDSVQAVAVESSVEVPASDRGSFYTFQASDSHDLIELNIEGHDGSPISSTFHYNRIPNIYENVGHLEEASHIIWELSRTSSTNFLQRKRPYYIWIKAPQGATFSVRSARTQYDGITNLDDENPMTGDLNQQGLTGTFTSGLGVFEYNFQTDQPDQEYQLVINPNGPTANRHNNPESLILSVTPGEAGFFKLPSSFLGKRTHLTLLSKTGTPATGIQFSLKSYPANASAIPSGERNYRLDASGRTIMRLTTWSLTSIAIRSDSNTRIVMINREGNVSHSARYQDQASIFIRPGASQFSHNGQTFISNSTSTQYDIIIVGEPGAPFTLNTSLRALPEENPITMGEAFSQTLEPHALIRHTLEIPEDAHELNLQLSKSHETSNLIYHAMERDAYTTGFTEQIRSFSQGTHHFRQFSSERLGDFPHKGFKPGTTYELWFYNDSPEEITYQGTLSTTTDLPTLDTLQNGDQLQISKEEDSYIHGRDNEAYSRAYKVQPAAGTQRVELEFNINTPEGYHPNILLKNQEGYLIGQSIGNMVITESELGYCPDLGFEILVESYVTQDPVHNFDAEVNLREYQARYPIFNDDSIHDLLMNADARFHAQLDVLQNTRKLDFGFAVDTDASTWLPVDLTRSFLTDPERIDSNLIRQGLYNYALEGQFAFKTLDVDSHLVSARLNSSDHSPNGFNYEGPLETAFHTRVHDFATDTLLPMAPLIEETQDLQQRLVTLVNPHDELLMVTVDEETSEIAPNGALLVRPEKTDEVSIKADKPLVIFEELLGESWSSLSAPSPYLHDRFTLPHLPPRTSPWQTIVITSNAGSQVGAMTETDQGSLRPIPPGYTIQQFPKGTTDKASWLQLAGGQEENSPFRESTIAATQYWTLDNFFAANSTDTKPSREIIIPHVPNFEQWWLGLSLSNTNPYTADMRIYAFDGTGNMVPGVKHLSIPGNETIIGVLSDFFENTQDVAWLRIESETPIMGMSFIGSNTDGADVASYALPGLPREQFILPGTGSDGWYGLAIINPHGQTQTVSVEAVALNGDVLATHETAIKGLARELVVGQTTFPNLNEPHYLRITSNDGRITAIQLSGHGSAALSLQSGVAIR